MLDKRLSRLWETLLERLRALAPLTIAYSGGLDSRFLSHAAVLAGLSPLLLHIRGQHVPAEESREALLWAHARGLGVREISLDPLSIAEVAKGEPLRCYHCKRYLFSSLKPLCEGSSASTLCDGTNASDLQAHRPGIAALHELGVRSPLAEAGASKDDIRLLGAATGLERPDQKARPCLLTRFAYHLSPTHQSLEALAKAEAAVEALLTAHERQAPDFRIRLTHLTENGFAVQLHLSALPEKSLIEKLRRAVTGAGLAEPELLAQQSLSGYFDRSL